MDNFFPIFLYLEGIKIVTVGQVKLKVGGL